VSNIIIAGPNGAGKTTFGDEYLSSKHIEFVNADEIARAMESRSVWESREGRFALVESG
jgi:predicted ABC-type ATPase